MPRKKNLQNVSDGDHTKIENQGDDVPAITNGGGAHFPLEHLTGNGPLPALVSRIVELWRRRQAWHRAEKSLTLQVKGFCRRLCPPIVGKEEKPSVDEEGGKRKFPKNPSADQLYAALMGKGDHPQLPIAMLSTLPLLDSRKGIRAARKAVEKDGERAVLSLPGSDFCLRTPGLTAFTLFAIIGECPGINMRGLLDFATPQRVWKRMGLAVMPDGTRQRLLSGAAAIEAGYNPARRAVVWTIGAALVKAQGPYRELYLRLKEKLRIKAESRGYLVLPSAKIPKNKEGYVSEGIIHDRAKRLMEKEFLRDLWFEFCKDAAPSTGLHQEYVDLGYQSLPLRPVVEPWVIQKEWAPREVEA